MDRETPSNQPSAGNNNQPAKNSGGSNGSVDFEAMVNQGDNAALPGIGGKSRPRAQQTPPDQGSNQSVPQTRSHDWMPHIADDTDLIEKEWVDKAKEIVDKYADDPYRQNKELNKVKAEYLKKRYNKVIAPSD